MGFEDCILSWLDKPAKTLASDVEIAAMLSAAVAEKSDDAKLWQDFAIVISEHTDPERHLEQRNKAARLVQGAAKKRTTPKPPPIPLASLPPLLRDVVVAADQQLNVQPELMLLAALAACALTVQGRWDVDQGRGYGTLTLCLFCLALAESGDGKTVTWRRALAGIHKAEKEDAKLRHVETRAYALAEKAYKDEEAKLLKEGLPQAEMAKRLVAIPRPKPVMSFRKTHSKLTTNGLLKDIAKIPSMGIFDGEAGALLDSHSFNNQAVEFAATLTSLWGGDPVGKNTGLDDVGGVLLYHRRLTMLLMAQLGIGTQFLTNSKFTDQGLINRFVVAEIAFRARVSPFAAAPDPRAVLRNEQAFKDFADRTYELVKQPLKVNDDLELEVSLVAWDGQGRPDKDSPAWMTCMRFVEHVNAEMYTTYKPVATFAKRIHEFAIKFAAIFALFDKRQTISVPDADAGVALAHYFLLEKMRLINKARPRSRDGDLYDTAVVVITKLQDRFTKLGTLRWSERELRQSVSDLKTNGHKRALIFKECEEQGWLKRIVAGTYNGNPTFDFELTEDGITLSEVV